MLSVEIVMVTNTVTGNNNVIGHDSLKAIGTPR